MRHLVVAIFVFHPFQHLASSVIVEVGIDIGERYTVGVEETLKQQVVFHRVYLGDAQTVCHDGSCCRSTSRSHHHSQLVACRVDEILHDEEVSRKSHRLHDMQLELHSFVHFLRQRIAVAFLCSVVGELGKIVCLKLYPIKLVDASQLFYLLVCLIFRQRILAVLV